MKWKSYTHPDRTIEANSMYVTNDEPIVREPSCETVLRSVYSRFKISKLTKFVTEHANLYVVMLFSAQ